MHYNQYFSTFAKWSASVLGHPVAFGISSVILVLWIATGPLFRFSDTWQLIVNTATSVVTFLMVFLIQHTQNRDTLAIQLKLAELLRALEGARTEMGALEDETEETLDELKGRYEGIAQRTKQQRETERSDSD
jgi:low affinity Fe/Cu permease